MQTERPRSLPAFSEAVLRFGSPSSQPFDALVEQANKLAGIVAVPSRRVVGEFVRRNEINAADFRHIHADLLRCMLDHALGEISGLRTSGTAIGTCLRRVREQAFARNVRVRPFIPHYRIWCRATINLCSNVGAFLAFVFPRKPSGRRSGKHLDVQSRRPGPVTG